jgi:O-antigen/teichoic acid export membrane protein
MTPQTPPRAPQKSASSRVGINALSNVCTRVLQIAVLFWVNRFLLQTIDAEEYSLFPLIASLVFFIHIVTNICTGGVARFLIVADARDDHEEVTKITSSMLPVLVCMAALIASVGGLVIWKIDRFLVVDANYVSDARLMLGMILTYVCLNLVATPFSAGLYIRQRFLVINLIQLTCEAMRAALVIGLLLGVSHRIIWLVVANLAMEVLNCVLRIVATRRMIPAIRYQPNAFEMQTAKTLLRFGAWTSTTAVADFVSKTAPILLLNRFATPIDLAVFHLGKLPDLQLRKIISAVMIPMEPALTSIYAKQGESVLQAAFYRGNRYCLWIALFFIGPLIIFADNIVHLYVGEKFSDSAMVMALTLARYPFLFATAMFYRVSQASGRVSAFYRGQIVVELASLGSIYAACRLGTGAVGVSVAIFAAESAMTVLLIWPIGLRFVDGRWSDLVRKVLVPGLIPFAVACFVCLCADQAFENDSWLSILATSAIAGCAYIVAMWYCLDDLDHQFFVRASKTVQSKLAHTKFGRGNRLENPAIVERDSSAIETTIVK